MTRQEFERVLRNDISILEENPDAIESHWNNWSPLFATVTPEIGYNEFTKPGGIGCVTLIKSGTHVASHPELTEYVRGLDIPSEMNRISDYNIWEIFEAQLYIDNWYRERGLR